jgi:hypothetical protein
MVAAPLSIRLAEVDVGALTKQVELALFFEAKLDPTAIA